MALGARGALAALTTVGALSFSSFAHADGDQAHSLLLHESAPGLGLTSAGVGLSGRRESGADVPAAAGVLTVDGVPAGATVTHAYLYWVTYGTAPDGSVVLDGQTVDGTLIGTSGDTCWSDFENGLNYVHRADVTALVTGNGAHTITGFPSATATADTQGASLVVVYDDPADPVTGTVIVRDGALTAMASGMVSDSFVAIEAPSTILDATLRIGAGDGQSSKTDGDLDFADVELTPPPSDHWGQSDGTFWDDRSYDVSAILGPDVVDAEWQAIMGTDCVVFAYAALSFRAEIVDLDSDGVDDGIDNCPGVTNADQADPDGDGFGDPCDNCPAGDNPSQSDGDDDGVGNLCDNCTGDPNPGQEDADGDGEGDVCDRDPSGSGGAGGSGSTGGGTGAGGEPGTGGNGGSGGGSGGLGDGGAGAGGEPGSPTAGPSTTAGSTTATGTATSSGAGGDGADGAAAEGDGCGCRTAGTPADPRGAALGAGLLALLVARLRRSGRRS